VDPETGQTIVSGMGELHLEVIKHRMLSDFHVAANVGKPRVSYKETIQRAVDCEADYTQAAGGHPQFARVKLHLQPVSGATALKVQLLVSDEQIPRAFHTAVKEGVEGAASSGVLAGYPVVGVNVTVLGGEFHVADSTEGAFAAAAAKAFRLGAEQAGVALLEPWMRFEVMTPEAHVGDVLADLSGRRAHIAEQAIRSGVHVLSGKVPLSEMFGYATALRSLTQGRATFTMEPVAYLPVPDELAKAMMF
jgi:elongation factor G